MGYRALVVGETRSRLTILAIFGSLVFVLYVGWIQFEKIQAQRTSIRADLTGLCESFPVSDELRSTGTQEVINTESGSFSLLFETDTDCNQAERPFYEFWLATGWKPTGERSPYYFKDYYVVSAACSPRWRDGYPNRVNVECGWDKAGTKKGYLK